MFPTDWACERVFAPYPDMEQALRKRNLPLYSFETFSPQYEFDVLGGGKEALPAS